MSTTLKRAAGWIGAAVCVLAAVLLLRKGLALGDALGARLTAIAPTSLVCSLVSYVVGAASLGVAWVLLVRAMSGAAPDGRALYIAHLRSQVAKYLPGNVFHVAYRHAAVRREGLGHVPLGAALALESVLLIAAAASLALGVIADPRIDRIAPWVRWIVSAAPLVALSACIAATVMLRRRAKTSAARVMPAMAGAFAIDIAFFVLAAAALRWLCAEPDALPFAAWCGWLALAWIAGYVTPGAPGGLGLREAVLVLGLGPVLGETEAIAIAFAYRFVTVGADAVLAGVGFFLGDRMQSAA